MLLQLEMTLSIQLVPTHSSWQLEQQVTSYHHLHPLLTLIAVSQTNRHHQELMCLMDQDYHHNVMAEYYKANQLNCSIFSCPKNLPYQNLTDVKFSDLYKRTLITFWSCLEIYPNYVKLQLTFKILLSVFEICSNVLVQHLLWECTTLSAAVQIFSSLLAK